MLRDVQIGVASMQTGQAGPRIIGVAGPGMPAGGPIPRATPTGKLKELQDRLQSSNANVAQAVSQLKTEGNKSSSMGFYLMILGYIAVSYMFS